MVLHVALVGNAIETKIAWNRWFPVLMVAAMFKYVVDNLAHFRGFLKEFRVYLEFELEVLTQMYRMGND